METIVQYTGRQIKLYRKLQGITIQNLADRINKSRATVSKYENGDIVLDIQTLEEIAKALNVEIEQLVCDPARRHKDLTEKNQDTSNKLISHNPFYESKRFYLYYYDGRYRRLKDGVIDISRIDSDEEGYKATLSLSLKTDSLKTGTTYYDGRVIYSDMLIRFSFLNLYNNLEEDLLYIFNPIDCRDFTEGLLCGISSADLLPCAFKCIVSLEPMECDDVLKKRLMITKEELQRWQNINMMVVENRPTVIEW